MKFLCCFLLLAGPLMAQPPGPPGPPLSPPKTGNPAVGKKNTPTAVPSPGGQANISLPHVVGQLSGSPSGRFTISRETGTGGPTARMDFRADTATVVTPGLKSGERVVVVYEMNPKGEGYRALAVVGCPKGSSPEELLKKLPKLKG